MIHARHHQMALRVALSATIGLSAAYSQTDDAQENARASNLKGIALQTAGKLADAADAGDARNKIDYLKTVMKKH